MSAPALIPSIFYRDKRAALDWLSRAFGFESSMVVTNADGSLGHCEMSLGDAVISVESEYADWSMSPATLDGANTQSIKVMIEDVNAHCARAAAAGAHVLEPPCDTFYGHRIYVARDQEGHVWRFGQVLQSMSAAEMEAASEGRKVRPSQ